MCTSQFLTSCSSCRSCTGGKTEDFMAAAQLMHKAQQQVKVPTFLVPATQKVWADVYGLPVPGCDGQTAAQIFSQAGCETPASPSCAACLGGPQDTYARMNEAVTCVSTTNRYLFPLLTMHWNGIMQVKQHVGGCEILWRTAEVGLSFVLLFLWSSFCGLGWR
jgi:aconitase B